MKVAFLFPGQGAQRVGMGAELAREFAAAREAFDEADEALGFALSKLCFEGPEEDLRLTANTQPATLATSIAALRAFEAEYGVKAEIAAGHSLGEYSALVAAGALEFRRGAARRARARPPDAAGLSAGTGFDGGVDRPRPRRGARSLRAGFARRPDRGARQPQRARARS